MYGHVDVSVLVRCVVDPMPFLRHVCRSAAMRAPYALSVSVCLARRVLPSARTSPKGVLVLMFALKGLRLCTRFHLLALLVRCNLNCSFPAWRSRNRAQQDDGDG